MDLPEQLLKNVTSHYPSQPVPIQQRAVPYIYDGHDVIGLAPTGQGKTAAYVIPILTMLTEDDYFQTVPVLEFTEEIPSAVLRPLKPLAVILLPTRELSIQVADDLRKFSRGLNARILNVFGGRPCRVEIARMKQAGCHILVATPGRLYHYIETGKIRLDEMLYLVLDEADQMFDMGFMHQVTKIIEKGLAPPNTERQTLMFSATFPAKVQKFAFDFLEKSHVHISVNEEKFQNKSGGKKNRDKAKKIAIAINPDIEQNIIDARKEKFEQLERLLNEQGMESQRKILLFVERKSDAASLCERLNTIKEGWAMELSSDMTQSERLVSLHAFKTGQIPILVATSVASRGLDIKGVDLVINYDLPKGYDDHDVSHMSPEQRIAAYVQRIGRTGRIGHTGQSIAFYDHSGKDHEIGSHLLKTLGAAQQKVPAWFLKLIQPNGANFLDDEE